MSRPGPASEAGPAHGPASGHDAGCYSCRENATADVDLPPRLRILRTARWRVVHSFNSALPGWLIVVPTRHVLGLAELDAAETAELGPLLADLSRALVEVVGCAKTYVMLSTTAAAGTRRRGRPALAGDQCPASRRRPACATRSTRAA